MPSGSGDLAPSANVRRLARGRAHREERMRRRTVHLMMVGVGRSRSLSRWIAASLSGGLLLTACTATSGVPSASVTLPPTPTPTLLATAVPSATATASPSPTPREEPPPVPAEPVAIAVQLAAAERAVRDPSVT